MENKKLPKGIRVRGNAYQWYFTAYGKQYAGTAPTLDEALCARAVAQCDVKKRHDEDIAEELRASQRKGRKPQQKDIITFAKAIEHTYKSHWKGTRGEATALKNAKTCMQFFGADTYLHDIDTEWVKEFVEHLENTGSADGTINRKLAALSVIIKVCREDGKRTADPVIRRRKEYKGRDRFITLHEEQQIMAAFTLWGKQDAVDVTVTLIDSGLRTGELFALERPDINFSQGKHGTITIWRTKNDTPRTVPMSKRVAEIIQRRLDSMAIGEKYIFPYDRFWYRTMWDRMKHHIGLGADQQFVPHILRHTCASRLIQHGIPLLVVKQWLGHASIQSTMRYAHLCPTQLYDALEVMEAAV